MAYGDEYGTSAQTASTSSIYEYPEHLNPFYQDENHKRLRFWKFGSLRHDKHDKPRSEKRDIRRMWESRSYRPQKKSSSADSFNKTSESPPPQRRNDPDVPLHTTNNNPSSPNRNKLNNTVPIYHHPDHRQATSNTPHFPRNSRERSSLQTNGTQNEIGLNRNDRVRNSFANGFRTYDNSPMITSTPRSRYNAGTTDRGMTTGVSQSNLKSTNPFDDDGMDDSISLTDSFNGTNTTSMRRKKGKAPPPPVRNIANKSVDPSDTALATRLKIEETPPVENHEDVKNLSKLTAEFNQEQPANQEKPEKSKPVEQMPQQEDLKLQEQPRQKTPPRPTPRSKLSPLPILQTPLIVEPVHMENVALPEKPNPTRRFNTNCNQAPSNGTELRTTQSSNSATTITAEEKENMEFKPVKQSTETGEKINTAHFNISESNGDIESLPTPSTAEKHYVRDIIKSINRNQSFRKDNHKSLDFANGPSCQPRKIPACTTITFQKEIWTA